MFHTEDIIWGWTQQKSASTRKTKSLSNLGKLTFQENFFKLSKQKSSPQSRTLSLKVYYKNKFTPKNKLGPIL